MNALRTTGLAILGAVAGAVVGGGLGEQIEGPCQVVVRQLDGPLHGIGCDLTGFDVIDESQNPSKAQRLFGEPR